MLVVVVVWLVSVVAACALVGTIVGEVVVVAVAAGTHLLGVFSICLCVRCNLLSGSDVRGAQTFSEE